MKTLISIILVSWVHLLIAQSPITTGEYFIDSDPGIGNATALAITAGVSVSHNFSIPLEALSTGSHFLYIRLKNDEDKWSLYARRPFFITAVDVPIANIVAAEYFFDSDPGIGNGTSISIESGAEVSGTLAVSLDALDPGMHYLHFRVKNNHSKWSLFARRPLYISPDIPNPDIIAAEYFIDIDPGVGNGLPVAITPGESISAAFEVVTSDTLMPGTHVLHLRVQTDIDKWSLYAKSEFAIENEVGVNDIESNLRIFPNPTTGELYMESDRAKIDGYDVIDMYGRVVLKRSHINSRIDLGSLSSGDYIIRIKFEDGTGYSKKIVKL